MTATSSVEALAVGRSAPTPADTAHVLGLIGGYQVSQAVYAAAALKLPDLVAAGVDTSDSLATRTGTVPDRVHRLLRSLAGYGFFTQTGSRSWAVTPAGQTPSQRHPGLATRPGGHVERGTLRRVPRPDRCGTYRPAGV